MNFDVGSLVKVRGREWVVLPESGDDPDMLILRPLVRSLAYGVASRLKPSFGGRAAAWRSVWQRRSDWTAA